MLRVCEMYAPNASATPEYLLVFAEFERLTVGAQNRPHASFVPGAVGDGERRAQHQCFPSRSPSKWMQSGLNATFLPKNILLL